MSSENISADSGNEISLGEDAEGKLEILNITPEEFVSFTREEKKITTWYANALWKIQEKSTREYHKYFKNPLTDPEVKLCLVYARRILFEQINLTRQEIGTWSEEDGERLKKLGEDERTVLKDEFKGEVGEYSRLSSCLDLFLRDAK